MPQTLIQPVPQTVPDTIVIPKAPPSTMVLWGRPSETKSFAAYVSRPQDSGGLDATGPLLIGAVFVLAALGAYVWAWRRARSTRTGWAAGIGGSMLLAIGAFALAAGSSLEPGQTLAARQEREHWLGVAENVVNDVLVERRASNRGFIRSLDRRRMIYTSPKWLLVMDFERDRFLAVPAQHVRTIDAPKPGMVPSGLAPEPRLDSPVVSFIPGGQPRFPPAGSSPYSGLGPLRIQTDIEQPSEIYLQRADQADLSPPAEFIQRLAAGLDPVEHYRQRSNLRPGGG